MCLTARQTAVVEFVRSFAESHGYAPTVREIAAAFDISTHGAESHLDALERKGAIQRTPRVARSIRATNTVSTV